MPEIERGRIAALFEREQRAFRSRAPALRATARARRGLAAVGRADELDDPLARRIPDLRHRRPGRRGRRRRRQRLRRPLPRRHRCDDRPLARRRPSRRSAARSSAGSRRCCRPRTRSTSARRCSGASGLRDWQFSALGHRRQPVRRSASPPDHRPAEGPRPQPLLPRQRRRDGRRRSSTARVAPRDGNVGPPVDPAETTRVVEINDLEALERELAHGDVACVLVEPALTNIGIVLADTGLPRARCASSPARPRRCW